MAQTTKHTQQLVEQFRHELLIRRRYLLDNEDKLEELFSGDDLITMQNASGDELDRLDRIFKLIKNNKL